MMKLLEIRTKSRTENKEEITSGKCRKKSDKKKDDAYKKEFAECEKSNIGRSRRRQQ